MKKHEMIEQIENNNLGSIYSKEDVIRLIEQIEAEPAEMKINPKTITILTNKITEHLENMDASDLVDFESADFSISYRNQVELDSIDVSLSIDEHDIESFIREAFEEESEDNDTEE